MDNKKVLIITYYWPPAGGAGVQRWLKFVKYLPEFGWSPVIYTVENGEFPVLDHSLEKEIPDSVNVIRKKIIEPYSWYKKFIGQKKEERINAGFLAGKKKSEKKENLAKWIRGNLFIPDARRFWIRPSIKYLLAYLKKNPVDIIISTGPPHSMHLIAMRLKKEMGIPWIADFRDPWTKIDFYNELKLSGWADRKHHRLEKQVVQSADIVLSINQMMRDDYKNMGAKQSLYLPNGFDPSDFPKNTKLKKGSKFRIVYIGSINQDRNPEFFWKTIKDLTEKNPSFANDLEIELIGKTDYSVHKLIESYQLKPYVSITDYLPHDEIFHAQKQASILLLLINHTPHARGILTGKMFEYLASGRAILAIGPTDGEAAMILSETKTGTTINYHDEETLSETLLKYYNTFLTGNIEINPKNIDKYTRKNLTGELTDIMDRVLPGNNQTN